jgi:hypothetical protein
VGEVAPDQAADWAAVMVNGFRMPMDGLHDLFIAAVSNLAFRNFAAWDGERMVAGASLLIQDGQGLLHSATTLPGYRNRGAHTGLLGARVRAAAEAGCAWVSAGTTSGANSFGNLRRLGMQIAYRRSSWVWRA